MQRQPIRRGYGARSALLLSESAGKQQLAPLGGLQGVKTPAATGAQSAPGLPQSYAPADPRA